LRRESLRGLFTVTLSSLSTVPLARQNDEATTRRRDVKTWSTDYPRCAFAALPAGGRQWQGREIWDHKHRDKHQRCL
jgi:hypothetical protein